MDIENDKRTIYSSQLESIKVTFYKLKRNKSIKSI